MVKQYEFQTETQQEQEMWPAAMKKKKSQKEQEKNLAEENVSTNVMKYMEKRLMAAFLSRQEKDRNSGRSGCGSSSSSNNQILVLVILLLL